MRDPRSLGLAELLGPNCSGIVSIFIFEGAKMMLIDRLPVTHSAFSIPTEFVALRPDTGRPTGGMSPPNVGVAE